MIWLGIDPGISGSVAWITEDGGADWLPWDNAKDVWDRLQGEAVVFGCVERVNAFPKQGVSSTFKFGASYGAAKMLLTALMCPWCEVSPRVWQKALGCLSGGDKNVTKQAAQRLFPNIKIKHQNADGLLIAYYARTVAGRCEGKYEFPHDVLG